MLILLRRWCIASLSYNRQNRADAVGYPCHHVLRALLRRTHAVVANRNGQLTIHVRPTDAVSGAWTTYRSVVGDRAYRGPIDSQPISIRTQGQRHAKHYRVRLGWMRSRLLKCAHTFRG